MVLTLTLTTAITLLTLMVTVSGDPNPTNPTNPTDRQNIVFVYATRIILYNISGIAVNTLLVGYPTDY